MKLIYNNKEVANNTKNYNELLNKPLLNSKELVGNISLNDINVYNKKEVDNLIASTRSVKAVTALPSPLVENTMYYVGPDADNNYHVYLVDSALTLIDLGMAREESMYKAGAGIEIDSSNNIMADLDYETVSLDSEGKIYVPTLEGTKGSDIRPVYLDNGTITQVNQAASGNYKDFVPFVSDAGVMEVGKYIDFHEPTSTADYDLRLSYDNTANTSKLKVVGGTAVGFVPVTGTATSVGSNILPVYVNNGTLTKTQSLFTVDGATNIPAKSNLNTTAFTACGKYSCGSSSNAGTLTNCPSTSGFNMIVENVIGPDTASLSNVGGWVSRTRTIENYYGDKWVQVIVKEGASDTTITYGEWRRVLDGKVSASGSRHSCYPYTNGANTAVGKFVDFYVENNSTSATSQIWAPNAVYSGTQVGDLRIENPSNTSRSGTVLTSGIVSLKHWHPTTNNTYISDAMVDGYVDHATCIMSGWFRLSKDVPAGTVLFTLPSGYKIADNTYGFIYGGTGGFKLAKAMYNNTTITADSAITANSENKILSITFMLSKYPA